SLAVPEPNANPPAETLAHPFALFLIEWDQSLGATRGDEPLPSLLEPIAQFAEIVNLAVEYDLHRAVLIRYGLIPACQIDDRKSPVDQSDSGFYQEPFGIRPAVSDTVAHGLEDSMIHRLRSISVQNPSNTAHKSVSSFNLKTARKTQLSILFSRLLRREPHPATGAMRPDDPRSVIV